MQQKNVVKEQGIGMVKCVYSFNTILYGIKIYDTGRSAQKYPSIQYFDNGRDELEGKRRQVNTERIHLPSTPN